jgi:hypothetical protein
MPDRKLLLAIAPEAAPVHRTATAVFGILLEGGDAKDEIVIGQRELRL